MSIESFFFVLLLGLALSPVGCFLIWRKWIFLNDSLAHSALLGAVLGIILNLNWIFTYFILILLIGISLLFNEDRKEQWLSLISYGIIPVGILLMSFLSNKYVNAKEILFGNPYSIHFFDWVSLIFLMVGVFIFYKRYFKVWLLISFSKEIACVEGYPVKRLELIFVFLISFSVALCMKCVGQLLSPGLMVMPAMAASYMSHTPQKMLKKSILLFIFYVSVSYILHKKFFIEFVPLFLTLLFINVILSKKVFSRLN